MTPVRDPALGVAGAHAGGGGAGTECRRSRRSARKWELDATVIGQVTDDGLFRVTHDGRTVAEIPGQPLVDDCPIYTPEAREAPAAAARAPRPAPPPGPRGRRPRPLERCSTRRPSRASGGSSSSTTRPSRPARCSARAATPACFRVGEESFALAVSVDCNDRLRRARPVRGRQGHRGGGGAQRRLHRRRPARHHRLPQLRQSREAGGLLPVPRGRAAGSATPAVAFDTPVTGGNVSFYNESPTGAVDPTPTVGMVGLLRRSRGPGAQPLPGSRRPAS